MMEEDPHASTQSRLSVVSHPCTRPESPVPFRPVPSSRRVSRLLIEPLLSRPERIRNVCILAHVDHGKTTLTDSLLASNGIISFKQAGTLRYMDARDDEQQRGITMESSAVSLLFDVRPDMTMGRPPSSGSLAVDESASNASLSRQFEGLSVGDRRFLVNLIDSPGHVDFASQVTTASKLCDGCLVLVDAVEGVCTQTAAVLRQAFRERLTPCLVINKMDRLVTELRMSSTEASEWLVKLLTQVNAIQATVSSSQFQPQAKDLEEPDEDPAAAEEPVFGGDVFCPSRGNVVFASATDGWAFRIDHFARLFARRLEMKEDVLQQTLWGPYYMDPRAKRVVGAKAAERLGLTKPMFAQFILENIWQVYETTSKAGWDQARIEKIAAGLNVRLPLRELKARDGKTVLRSVMTTWLPLADSAFAAIVDQLPNPVEAARVRIPNMFRLNSLALNDLEAAHECPYPEASKALLKRISGDDSGSSSSPTVAYLSKQFAVTSTERAPVVFDDVADLAADGQPYGAPEPETITREKLIGMVRLFHGSLAVGEKIRVLRPKYNPAHPADGHWVEIVVEELFLLMGRDLEPVDRVYAGNVFGIGGLERHVGKSATLSDTLDCPSFDSVSLRKVVPIVRVAVHPANVTQMAQLEAGLKLLCQADPCAETYLQEENGEYILAAAGELHLEQCLKDLRVRFTKIEIEISPPMVPFRETITADLAITDAFWRDGLEESRDEGAAPSGAIRVCTPTGNFRITVRAFPLEPAAVDYILLHKRALRTALSDDRPLDPEDPLAAGLLAALRAAPVEDLAASSILALGPKRCGPNVLLASAACVGALQGEYREFLNSILPGFQIAAEQGPLCAEPLMGVGFVIEGLEKVDWPSAAQGGEQAAQQYCALSNTVKGQLISTTKDACHRAMMYRSPRLMLAMYSCDIQTTAEVLGRVYSVVGRRLGTILAEEYNEEIGFFTVKSLIPVTESFGFADDIRGRTSGLAIPQLLFHGFRVFDQDPFWVPTTEEELEDFGEVAEKANVALRYLIKVRERKGLFVEKKIVQSAEKQRTLKK